MKSGFCAILGRPNAGKSTLLNALLSKEVSIVSRKAQTTRDDIVGIYHGKDLEISFIDTPGIFEGSTALDKSLLKNVRWALKGADCLLYLVDASRKDQEEEAKIIEGLKISIPAIIVLNKIDLCRADEMEATKAFYGEHFPKYKIIECSALTNFGFKEIKDAISTFLPETGFAYYPEEVISDKDERFIAKEVIREKLLHFLHEEVPHQCAVTINSFKEEKGAYYIKGKIIAEKENQKAIIIGKGGEMIKKISMSARQDLEKRWGKHVTLIVNVEAIPGWRNNPNKLAELGYGARSDDD